MVDIRRLRRFKFLASVSDEELTQWLPKFGEQIRPRNEVIFREGEEGDKFYLIEAGQVTVTRNVGEGREQFIGYYGLGEFFGEGSLITHQPRFASIEAVAQTMLLYLAKDDFLELYEKHPAVKAAIDAVAAQRIQRRVAQFPSKREEEALVLAKHRHWLWFAIRAGTPALITLLAGGVVFAVGNVNLLPLYILLVLICGAIIAWFVVDWRNDWFVLSSRRVLHREKVVLLFEAIEEAPLDKIQNVTSSVPNLVANILNFGDVIIQTAAGQGRITFDFIPQPRVMSAAIEQEMKSVREHARQQEITRMRQTIRSELEREIRGSSGTPAASSSAGGVTMQERPGALRRMFGGMHILPPTYVKKGEEILWRRHELLLLKDIALPFVALLLIVSFCLIMIYSNLFGVGLVSLPVTFLIAVIGIPLSGFWLWYRYKDWENDIYVLTPERLVDSERTPLGLRETVKVAPLGQVQNVTFRRNNIIETIFDFGTVTIQTAGQSNDLIFEEVPHPAQAQQQISDALERFKAGQQQRDLSNRRREFLDWFVEYQRLHDDFHRPVIDP